MSKPSSAVKRKYNKKAYERIEIFVKIGHKSEIKSHASALGMSVNAYITSLIERDMAKSENQSGDKAESETES
jgi:predicted DNA binding CopG/RHH family protein